MAERFRKSMRIKAPNVAVTTGKLSGGNQQKVVLSKWIFTDPDVLILDEPTRGIDVGAKYEIYTIINELAAQGRAIIVISSELPELLGICDRIYALSAGRITGEVPQRGHTQKHHAVHDQREAASSRTPVDRHVSQRHDRAAACRDLNPAEKSVTDRLQPSGQLRQDRHLHRADRHRRSVLVSHRRHSADAAQRHQPLQQNVVRPRSSHRHGDGHHRRAHRPVGRIGGGLRRCDDRGIFIVNWGMPWWLAAHPLHRGRRASIGAWQGFWVAYVGIPAFIVTLAGMLTFRGLDPDGAGQCSDHPPVPRHVRAIGSGFLPTSPFGIRLEARPLTLGPRRRSPIIGARDPAVAHRAAASEVRPGGRAATLVHRQAVARRRRVRPVIAFALATYQGIPIILVILAALVLIYSIVMNRSVFGRHIYALGGNLHAAQLSGHRHQAGRLLAVREHGRACRDRRPHLHRPKQLRVPGPATASSSRPSRPRSSVARPCTVASARSAAPSSAV